MNLIIVDDERLALENLMSLVQEVLPDAKICGFQKPEEALAFLSKQGAHIAFLDIEMGSMSGIALAKKCKDLCPAINIIFATGHSQYTMDAMQMHASGYLIKPIRRKSLCAEIDNLRHPLPPTLSKRVRLQTFGSFEVFVNKKPLYFSLMKCKECLAYLVDRKGACITTAELAAVLWEDRPYDKTVQNNTHRVISDMMKTLKKEAAAEIIIKTRREIGIDTEKVDCDYYHFLRGDVPAINSFHGEYMSNYGWSEFTLAE